MTNEEKVKEILVNSFGFDEKRFDEIDCRESCPPVYYYSGLECDCDCENCMKWWNMEYVPVVGADAALSGDKREAVKEGVGKAGKTGGGRSAGDVKGDKLLLPVYEKVALHRIGKLAKIIRRYAKDGVSDGIQRYASEIYAQCELIKAMKNSGY